MTANTSKNLGTIQPQVTKKIPPAMSMDVFSGEQKMPDEAPSLSLTIADILKTSRVFISEQYEVPPRAISIITGEEISTFGTLGNFSLVKGKAKSKKTFLMCLVLAACSGEGVLQEKIKCELPTGKVRVLLFDTEQSKFHVWKRLKAIAALARVEDLELIEVYSLREYDPQKRCEIIEYALTEGNPENNIGIVVIDGIRDLINDINDPKEGTFIATKLMQWTTLAWCHIITVLHENKGDTNPRGHVGTELLNKAETVIGVTVHEKDKAVSIVEAEMTRDKDFPAFAFTITESGMPSILEDFEMNGKTEKKKSFDPYGIQPEIHQEIIRKSFTQSEQSRPILHSALKTAWGAYSQTIGNNKTDDLIAYYSQMGWIRNDAGSGKPAKYKCTC